MMAQVKYYNSTRYAQMLRELLDADEATEVVFEKHFAQYGLTGFFIHLDALDVPEPMMQTIVSLKEVMMIVSAERR